MNSPDDFLARWQSLSAFLKNCAAIAIYLCVPTTAIALLVSLRSKGASEITLALGIVAGAVGLLLASFAFVLESIGAVLTAKQRRGVVLAKNLVFLAVYALTAAGLIAMFVGITTGKIDLSAAIGRGDAEAGSRSTNQEIGSSH